MSPRVERKLLRYVLRLCEDQQAVTARAIWKGRVLSLFCGVVGGLAISVAAAGVPGAMPTAIAFVAGFGAGWSALFFATAAQGPVMRRIINQEAVRNELARLESAN